MSPAWGSFHPTARYANTAKKYGTLNRLDKFEGDAVTDRMLGSSFPLGATVSDGGVNFSIFSKSAESVELLLFDHPEDRAPARTVLLDPRKNRTYHYWHVFLPGVGQGQVYGYR